jgi:hypothetical protein
LMAWKLDIGGSRNVFPSFFSINACTIFPTGL